jgi:hypothetical protein
MYLIKWEGDNFYFAEMSTFNDESKYSMLLCFNKSSKTFN